MAHLRLLVDSIEINELTSKVSRTHHGHGSDGAIQFVAKALNLSKVSLDLERCDIPNDMSVYEQQALLKKPPSKLILHPADSIVHVIVGVDESTSSLETLRVNVTASVVDVVITHQQLALCHDAAQAVEVELKRQRFFHLRPGHDKEKVVTARDWWQYAIKAVVAEYRGNRGRFRLLVEDRLIRAKMRRQYVSYYRQIIETRIKAMAQEDLKMTQRRSDKQCSTSWTASSESPLDPTAERKFNEIETFFSLQELLLFRSIVHQRLRAAGFSLPQLRESIAKRRSRIGGWFGKWISDRRMEAESASISLTGMLIVTISIIS